MTFIKLLRLFSYNSLSSHFSWWYAGFVPGGFLGRWKRPAPISPEVRPAVCRQPDLAAVVPAEGGTQRFLECRHELDEASLPWTAILQSRRLMEKVACGFSKTTNKDVFLTLTMNLDAIGPYCSGLGILQSTIADGVPMPSVRVELSHGAVGEIADMYSCAHDLLNTLFPDNSAEEWKLVVKKTQAKRLRSKQKAKLGNYLVTTVTMSSENIETGGEGEGNNVLDEPMPCDSMLGRQNRGVGDSVYVGGGGDGDSVSVGVGGGGVSVII